MNLSWIQGFECALRAGGRWSGAARRKRGAPRRMPYRLVSPDRKLYLVDNEEDLKGVGKLYGLTSKQLGNVRQLLSWTGVGNQAAIATIAQNARRQRTSRSSHEFTGSNTTRAASSFPWSGNRRTSLIMW